MCVGYERGDGTGSEGSAGAYNGSLKRSEPPTMVYVYLYEFVCMFLKVSGSIYKGTVYMFMMNMI